MGNFNKNNRFTPILRIKNEVITSDEEENDDNNASHDAIHTEQINEHNADHANNDPIAPDQNNENVEAIPFDQENNYDFDLNPIEEDNEENENNEIVPPVQNNENDNAVLFDQENNDDNDHGSLLIPPDQNNGNAGNEVIVIEDDYDDDVIFIGEKINTRGKSLRQIASRQWFTFPDPCCRESSIQKLTMFFYQKAVQQMDVDPVDQNQQ